VLAVGYTLLDAWVREDEQAAAEPLLAPPKAEWRFSHK